MVKTVRSILGTLLVVVIFLAWADGRGPASDFARSAGRISGDVISAVIDFFDGLRDNKPDAPSQ